MRKTLLRALAAVWILALALLLWQDTVLADRAGALASLDAQTDLQCAEALSAIHTSLFYTDSPDQAQLADPLQVESQAKPVLFHHTHSFPEAGALFPGIGRSWDRTAYASRTS